MKSSPILLLLIVLAAALGVGCLGLSPKVDATRYFVLTSEAETPDPAAPRTELSLCLRRVGIPDYLAKRWLALRRGNEIVYADYDEWAEDLGRGFQRVLASNLSRLLGIERVELDTCDPATVTYEVQAHVLRFEMTAEGEAVLAVQWDLLGSQAATPLRSGLFSTTRRDPAARGDPRRTVQLLSELVADFSRELAETLASGPEARPLPDA